MYEVSVAKLIDLQLIAIFAIITLGPYCYCMHCYFTTPYCGSWFSWSHSKPAFICSCLLI